MKIKLVHHQHGGSFWYRPEKAKADLYVLKEMGTYWKRIDINKQDIWLDGGANIGAFSVRLAPQVKKIVAVEAVQSNYQLLTRNLKQNKCKNVTTVKAALVGSISQKKVEFVLDEGAGGPGRGSMFRVIGRAIKVDAVNISALVKKHKINCLKLDIEGAEVQCLVSLRATGVLKQIDQIVLEFHFSMLKDKDRSKFALVRAILDENFKTVKGHTLKEAKKLNLWTTLLYAAK